MNETKRAELKQQILAVLKDLNDSELVTVWNEYCDRVNAFDDRIEDMDMLPEYFNGDNIFNILNRAFFGSDQFYNNSSFNPNRDFFTFNGYGNLISLERIGWNQYANEFMYNGLDVDVVIDYIIENNDALYCDDIQDVLDEYDEEEKENTICG